jgi:predicted DsbA family dithiol-disulfide isomerase
MHVEIWSDLACPWCYIGMRRFEVALDRFEHRGEVEVTWRSFELDPNASAAPEGDRVERLARKYGTTRDMAEERQRQIAELAAADGLEMSFEQVRDGNTFDAHRLLHLAAAHGLQGAVNERLFRARFAEGVLLSEHAELERLGAEAGLPAAELSELLAGDRFADDVRSDERTAAELGITAVPFYVVDRGMGASGAQAPEVFDHLLERGWAQRTATIRKGAPAGADALPAPSTATSRSR